MDLKPTGTAVRDRYPLVVMLALNDRNIEDQVEVNDVVSLTFKPFLYSNPN